LKYVVRIIHL